jgi:hypothetical protein
MCSHFPNTFSRGTVQKFHGTPFEKPWDRASDVNQGPALFTRHRLFGQTNPQIIDPRGVREFTIHKSHGNT